VVSTPPSGVYSPSHILQKYDDSLFARQSWTQPKLLPEAPTAVRHNVLNLSSLGTSRKPIIEEVKVPKMRKMIRVAKTAVRTSCKKRDHREDDSYVQELKQTIDRQFIDEKKRLLLDFIRVKQKYEADHA